ncbi:unnamed protein product [marine sediment metagenome]|uniref:Uncharacterized protein n=1 Tax=marine sediment metagenome TaxID=412755 RepID=X1NNL7_9ZZZZ
MGKLPEGNATSWHWKEDTKLEKVLVSNPPEGKYKIINIYWDDELQKIVIEMLTEPKP